MELWWHEIAHRMTYKVEIKWKDESPVVIEGGYWHSLLLLLWRHWFLRIGQWRLLILFSNDCAIKWATASPPSSAAASSAINAEGRPQRLMLRSSHSGIVLQMTLPKSFTFMMSGRLSEKGGRSCGTDGDEWKFFSSLVASFFLNKWLLQRMENVIFRHLT